MTIEVNPIHTNHDALTIDDLIHEPRTAMLNICSSDPDGRDYLTCIIDYNPNC